MSSRNQPIHATENEALRFIRLLVNHLQRSARSIERRTGVTNAQLFLLQALRAGPLSVNALAALARTDQSTASLVTRRLVRARLVRKTRAALDRRRVEVSLTPRGRALLRRAPVAPTASLLRALHRLRRDDARALTRGLDALLRTIRPTIAPPAMLFESPRTARMRAR